eukprot:5990758-Ditylum_brightwellii.AAC.1
MSPQCFPVQHSSLRCQHPFSTASAMTETDKPDLPLAAPLLTKFKQECLKNEVTLPIKEKHYKVTFQDNAEFSEACENPFVGCVSSADVLASNMGNVLKFKTAEDTIIFAKKRGWDYAIEAPVLRMGWLNDA